MALLDSIIGAESGGNPNATNSSSSAGGLGQFINSTWLDMLQKYRPDLAQLPQDQQLKLKFDPALSREMTGHYADENAALLRGKGLPADAGSLYLAHFAGPQGAVKALSADPSTPISHILTPAALAANPFLAKQGIGTAGDLIQWAGRRVSQQGSEFASNSPGYMPSQPSNNAAAPAPVSSSPPSAAPSPQVPAAGSGSAPILPDFAQPFLAPPQLPPLYFAPRRPVQLALLNRARG